MKSYSDFGIDVPSSSRSGNVKTYCPKCRDTRSNKRDKSLSVDVARGVWHCHYCNWSGSLNVGKRTESTARKTYAKPPQSMAMELPQEVLAWFASRGISPWVLQRANVSYEAKQYGGETQYTVFFNYMLNGERINYKTRSIKNKTFTLFKDGELIPYNIDSICGTKECIITEGEMDCLSFIEAGYPNCISVPNGANANMNWMDDFVDGWFEDKETIYIATDTDKAGLKLREELIRRFKRERCKIIEFGAHKDANEVLQYEGVDSLRGCFERAVDVAMPGVYSLDDYEEELDELFKEGHRRGFVTGHYNLDQQVSFELQRLAIVTGVPGSGKSEFIDEMCVRFNLYYDYRVAFFSPENMPTKYHAVKILEKLSGRKCRDIAETNDAEAMTKEEYSETKDYYRDNFFHIIPDGAYTIDNILENARYLVRKRGIRVMVIDPFNRIESEQSSKETETQYISRVLDRLTNFAQQFNVLIFLMAHPTKVHKNNGNNGIPTMYDINGSANFFNKADFGLVVHRDRDNGYTLVKVEKVKFRHLGSVGDVAFKFNPINGRYVPYDRDENTYISFEDHMENMAIQKKKGTLPRPKIEEEDERNRGRSQSIIPAVPALGMPAEQIRSNPVTDTFADNTYLYQQYNEENLPYSISPDDSLPF